MAGRYEDDDENALPWLEPADPDDDEEGGGEFPYRGLMLAGASIVGVVALLWFVAEYFGGTPPGPDQVASAEIPLIQAPDTPYKERPENPGGLEVDASSLTHQVADGGDPGSRIAVGDMPEEPLPVTRTAPPELRRRADTMPTRIEPIVGDEAVKPPAPEVKKPASVVPAKPVPEPVKPVPAVKPALPKPDPVKAASTKPAAASGSVTVQLGAFSSAAIANDVWAKLAGRVPALGGLSKSVPSVDAGGKTLYRLRATGIASEAEASAICAKVQAAGEQCAVVR